MTSVLPRLGKPMQDSFVKYEYVIVGAGNAAGYAAKEFVDSGELKDGELCLIGSESVLPYERPALSKGFMMGKSKLPGFNTCAAAKQANKQDWYDRHGIKVFTSTTVTNIDFANKLLTTNLGKRVTYNKLLLATGGSVRRLKVEGNEVKNIFYLRDYMDGQKLRGAIENANDDTKVVVVGGGYIGTEMAAAILSSGVKNVTMIVRQDRIVARVMPPDIASVYEKAFEERGANIIKGASVTGFTGVTKVDGVVLEDGRAIEADLVVVGVGGKPNTELFSKELEMEQNGVKCDGYMETSEKDVYACGDIATYPIKVHGEMRRLEHVRSARATAQHAARSMLEVWQREIDFLPVFYSRIFDFSWEMCGRMSDEVVLFGFNKEGEEVIPEKKFGCVWLDSSASDPTARPLVGVFLEGGTAEDKEKIAKLVRAQAPLPDTCFDGYPRAPDPEAVMGYVCA